MASRAKAAAPAPSLVAPVRTRLDGNQASDALRAAWTNVTGEPPSEKTVAILTAQWAHETGNGASMYNYNFGGIKGMGPSGIAVQQRTKSGDHIGVRFLPEAPDVSKPVGQPKIFLEVGSHLGLIIATAYTAFGLCFFCYAHWRLRQMVSKHHAKHAA